MFVGYSFSHPKIRNSVMDALDTNKIRKLGILTPRPEKIIRLLDQSDKYVESRKIEPLIGSFGDESGTKAILDYYRQVRKGCPSFNT